MKPFIKQYCLFSKKLNSSLLQEDSDQSDRQFDQNKVSLQKVKQKLLLKNYSQYGQQQYHRLGQKKTYYYYKQWIWMQFPWISQSVNNNFSKQIFHCMKSPTQFMSIDQQFKNIQSAVKIAKIARNNKKKIYQQKQIQISPITSKLLFRKTGSFTQISHCINKKTSNKKITNRKTIKQNKINQSGNKSHKYPKNNECLDHSKDVLNTFITNFSVDQSCIENDDIDNYTIKKLPLIQSKLSQSKKWLSKSKNKKGKSQQAIISKINEIKNQNNKLLRTIQQMKKNKQNMQNSIIEPKIIQMKQKLHYLKKQNNKIQKMYKAQELLKGKLQTIIKLCDINKSHGSQSADLSSFLSSLKYMTKIQQQNIQKLSMKGKKIIQQNKQKIKQIRYERQKQKEKLKKKQKSIKQIKNQKSVKILGLKNQEKPKLLKKKKVNIQKDEEKKKVLLFQELQKMRKIEENFKENFNITYGQDNKQILDQIQYLFTKNKQLSWKLTQIKDQNNSKQRKLLNLQVKAEELSYRKQYNLQRSLRQEVSILQEKKRQQLKRKQYLNKCLKLLQKQQ